MFLGVVTFARAATLAGIALPTGSVPKSAITSGNTGISNGQSGNAVNAGLIKAIVSGGRQSVITEFKDGYYVPFAVQAGIPLAWTIRITADDLNGCNEKLVVPAYNIKKRLEPGDNVIEFTPTKAGNIAYSCWMGMIRSSITVAEGM
jgi:plastocyanin domain-containing protein